MSYLAMFCLWVCLSVQVQESRFKTSIREPTPSPRHKTPHQGTNTLSKAKNASSGNQHPLQGTKRLIREPTPSPRQKTPREAKSKHLVKFPFAGFCPSSLFFSLTPHGLLARQRGAPEHRVSGALTSRGLTHPPALLSPDSNMPKRRWCSAKRGS